MDLSNNDLESMEKGLRLEIKKINDQDLNDALSCCDSPGPGLRSPPKQRPQPPLHNLTHFPSICRDSSDNYSVNSNNSAIETIKYKKFDYLTVEEQINRLYYDGTDYYSSALDIFACYVRVQKTIYMKSKYHIFLEVLL